MSRYLGGLITKDESLVIPADNYEGTSAPGVWTLEEAQMLAKQGKWPTAGNPAPYWGTQFSGSKSSPTQLPGEWANISQIGNSYGLYGLKGNGEIWAWGNSNPYYGYLLTGNINDGTARSSPVLVGGQNKWANTDDSFNNMYYGHIGLVNSIPADDL